MLPGLIGSASFLWSTVNKFARKRAFSRDPVRLPARVVSVGNIQVGGAGKTPVVVAIARKAIERGLWVCILSRGYRSEWESKGGIIQPHLENIDPKVCGDEPALLHWLVPEATIAVGADRLTQFKVATQTRKFDLVILDDGFQNWKIHKDCDIVLLTSKTNKEVVFRESESALQFADFLLWTKGALKPVHIDRPLMKVSLVSALVKGSVRGPIILVTGVGDSRAVKQAIEATGVRVAEHDCRPDHYAFSETDVKALLSRAKENSLQLALTGKDWVKWRSYTTEDVIVFESQLAFSSLSEEELFWSRVFVENPKS